MLSDPLQKRELEALLGLKIGEAQPEPKYRVPILVPSYKGMYTYPDMFNSMIEMKNYSRSKGIGVVDIPSTATSIAAWSRNSMVADLYKNGIDYTHILFMDDDMAAKENHLVKLLSHDVDIVSGLCVGRKYPYRPVVRRWDREKDEFCHVVEVPPDTLLADSTIATGAAFTVVSRKAVEMIGDFYLDCKFERVYYGDSPRMAEISAGRKKRFETEKNGWWFQNLPHMSHLGEMGEDISFGVKAILCGLKVHVDTSVQPGHLGDYPFTYADWAGIRERQKAKETVVIP